jgi:uncharacterized membrane protein
MRSGEIQRKFGLLALCVLVGFPALAKADVKFNITTIDVPFCGPAPPAPPNPTPCPTAVNGNSTNAIVGEFDGTDKMHGFVLSLGAYTTIDFPFPRAASSFVNGVNASSQLVGTYTDQSGNLHAYFCSGGRFCNGGSFVSIDPIDPIDHLQSVRSQGGFINAQGQVVGTYRDASQKRHGFIWMHGTVTATFNVPNDDPVLGTVALGINDRGQIVGDFVDAPPPPTASRRHGFLRDSAGKTYTTLDPPGSTLTVAQGINNSGVIVGLYIDKDGKQHGFVLSDGVYTTIDVPIPGAINTEINSINATGQIGGQYQDGIGTMHGFVGTPAGP